MMITSVTAIVMGLLFVALSVHVIYWRRTLHVGLGDGGHDRLQKAIRMHGNFTEYTPFILILLGLAELQQAPWPWLALLGLLAVTARCLHATGLWIGGAAMRLRVIGMALTFSTILALVLTLAVLTLRLG